MSKKQSTKKSSDVLDEGIKGEEKVSQKSATASATREVSLKEFRKDAPYAFSSKNYKLLLIGLAVNIIGFILMIGGATDDPAKFDGDALFSTTRITIAPMFIVAGYLIIMYAIMRKTKTDQQ